MKLTSLKAQQHTGGKSTRKWQANAIAIDTRNLKPGDLFVALKGNNTNGYHFIKDAFNKGAAAAIVTRQDVKEEDLNYPLLIVEDSFKALIDLAKAARKNFKGRVIAVTGSVGKTTTKEMLKLALSNVTTVYANKGNYNNHIGMPLSLANLDNSFKVAIFELGMNKKEEIATLSKILQPHVAIITEVSNTHSAFFNNLEEIFLAKMEVVLGLVPPKVLLFNSCNNFFEAAKAMAKKANITFYSFGEVNCYSNASANNNLSKEAASNNETNNKVNFMLLNSNIIAKVNNNQDLQITQAVTAAINQKIYEYTLPALAKHKALLSVLALAVVDLLGLDVEKAKTSFNNYFDMAGRGEITKIIINKAGQKVNFFMIDDSYNASPLSMQKSILMLKDINIGFRKVLVLGDMLELKNEILEHQKLKEYILEVEPVTIFTLGSAMSELNKILPKNIPVANYLNVKELQQKLISSLQNNDIVLFKGSLGSNLHQVVKELKGLNNI